MSVGDDIRSVRITVFDGTQYDDQSVGQAGNGDSRTVDKALIHAELIRAVSPCDTDTAGAYFNMVDAVVVTPDIQRVRLFDLL